MWGGSVRDWVVCRVTVVELSWIGGLVVVVLAVVLCTCDGGVVMVEVLCCRAEL